MWDCECGTYGKNIIQVAFLSLTGLFWNNLLQNYVIHKKCFITAGVLYGLHFWLSWTRLTWLYFPFSSLHNGNQLLFQFQWMPPELFLSLSWPVGSYSCLISFLSANKFCLWVTQVSLNSLFLFRSSLLLSQSVLFLPHTVTSTGRKSSQACFLICVSGTSQQPSVSGSERSLGIKKWNRSCISCNIRVS